MTYAYKIAAAVFLLLLIAPGLTGCSEPEAAQQALEPVAFHDSDECHICGMAITKFPGPKGQAVNGDGVKKFCSTAEMLGWALQPENQHRQSQLYVHDMGRSDWNHPEDKHLVDARKAWYVSGANLKGSMGAVLASFADEEAAKSLAEAEGGRVLRFSEIDLEFLHQAAAMQHHTSAESHSGH